MEKGTFEMKKREKAEPRRLKNIWFTMAAVLLVFWFVFIVLSTAVIGELERQNKEAMQSVLRFAVTRLENRLEEIEDFLKVKLVSDSGFERFRNLRMNRAANLRQVSLQMDSDGQYFSDCSGIFFYEPEEDILLEKQWNDISDYSFSNETRRMELRETIMEFCIEEGKHTDGEWSMENVEGKWTAFYAYQYEGQYFGVYVSLDGMLERMIELGEIQGIESSGLTDLSGQELTGKQDRSFPDKMLHWENGVLYIQLTENIEGFPAKIVALISGWQFYGSWIFLWGCFLFLVILSGFFLLRLLRTLQGSLFGPLESLSGQMRNISGKDLNAQISEQGGCREVRQLYASFYEMLRQLHDMKIENYEKRLENQETEMKFLQIQKNPHFFLNVLNVIYSLAVSEGSIQIRTVTLELIRHIRYVMSVEEKLVILERELEFTCNFLEIQRIRFPFGIEMNTEGFTEEVRNSLVPPLILQTFVENAVKYALSDQDNLRILLQAEIVDDGLKLKISDSGPGFPSHILQDLQNSGTVQTDKRGKHIGIHNILNRMKLLYGSSCFCRFSNLSCGGAQIELFLPQKSDFEKKEV